MQDESVMRERMLFSSRLCMLTTLLLSLGSTTVVTASSIDPGFDLYTVITGSTFTDLDPVFPGAGTIDWEGVSLDAELGNTHTVIQRTTGLTPFPIGDAGDVSIEMIGSHLISVAPVDTTPFGLGPGLADLHAVINPLGDFAGLPDTSGLVAPSVGSQLIAHRVENGGTFSILMDVNPLLVLTTVGGDISDLGSPDVLLALDGTGLLNPVGSIGGEWSHTPTPTRDLAERFFPAGGFYSASDPTTGALVVIDLTSGGIDAAQGITASQIPEPTSLLLLCSGLFSHRRRLGHSAVGASGCGPTRP